MARLHYAALPEVSDPVQTIRQVDGHLSPFIRYFYTAKNAAQNRKPVLAWRFAERGEIEVFRERQEARQHQRADRANKAERRRDRHVPRTPGNGIWVVLEALSEEADETFESFLKANGSGVYDRSNCDEQSQCKVVDADFEGLALLLDREPEPLPPDPAQPEAAQVQRLWLRPNTYSIERQLGAAHELQNAPMRRHAPLVRLFANGPQWLAPTVQAQELAWQFLVAKPGQPLRDGTDEQREFVRRALATPDFAILEGPPGSGKSTAICELVAQLALRGKRVLLVASTHVAVDNVLERIIAHQDHKGAKLVLPVRIGDENNITAESVEPWRYQTLLRTSRDELDDFLERAKRRKALVDPKGGDARDQLEAALKKEDVLPRIILDSSNLVCGTTIGILQHPEIKRAALARRHVRGQAAGDADSDAALRPFDVMILDEASKTTFGEFLVPALLCERWVVVGDTKQLSPYVEAKELEDNLAGLVDSDVATAAVHCAVASRTSGHQRTSLLATTPKGGPALLAEAKARGVLAVDLDASEPRTLGKVDNAIPELLYAQIVAGRPETLRRLEHRLPNDLQLLGGAVPELSDWRAMRRATTDTPDDEQLTWAGEMAWRIVRAHELRQNPIERAHLLDAISELMPKSIGAKVEELNRDVMLVRLVALPSILELLQCGFGEVVRGMPCAMTNGLPAVALGARMTSLSFQHRMHPEISAFPRQRFYSPSATPQAPDSFSIVRRRRPIVIGPPEGLVSVPLKPLLRDSSTMHADREWTYRRYARRAAWLQVAPRESRGNVNSAEVEVLMREVEQFVGWATRNPHPDGRPWEVAALTFYRAQEKALRRELQRLSGQRGNTRHFSWEQDDRRSSRIAIKLTLCTVDRFQGHEADLVLLSFVRSSGGVGFLNSPNRLNVGLTRARYQLVMIGDRRFFAAQQRSPLLAALATSDLYSHDIAWKTPR